MLWDAGWILWDCSMITETGFDNIKNPDEPTIENLTTSPQCTDIRIAILNDWREQQNHDREDRRTYLTYLLCVFILQLILMHGVLFLIAFGKIALTDIQFTMFFVSVLAEIVALVCVVTKYLFPDNKSINILELLQKF